MDKRGQLKLDAWTVVAGLVVAYILVSPFRGFVDGLFSGVGTGAAPADDSGVTIDCIYDGAVMTIGPVVKRYAPTTSLSGHGHRIYVNGVDRGLKVDGSTLDVTHKDDIQVFYNQNNSASGTNSLRYYGAELQFEAPCASTFSTGDSDIDAEGNDEVIAMGLPTLTAFNDDDGLKNARAAQENISADDSANIELKVVKTSKAGFSPMGKQLICVKYNSTLYDDVELTAVSGVSGSVTEVGTPEVVNDQPGKLGSASGYSHACFESDGTDSSTTITEIYNLYVETSSSSPATNANPGKSALNISMVDQDFYRNSDTGEMEFGYEDNDDNDVGLSTAANLTVFMS